MFRLFKIGFFLMAIVSCRRDRLQYDKPKSVDKPLVVLTYGLPNINYQRAEDVVARKYGVKFRAVAGCVVSPKLVDSVRLENEKVYRILAQRFGSNWKTKFDAEVDSMVIMQMQVEELVKQEPFIARRISELEKEHNALQYWVDPTENPNEFLVTAYGWRYDQNESGLVVYYKLKVGIANNSVILVSDKDEPVDDRTNG